MVTDMDDCLGYELPEPIGNWTDEFLQGEAGSLGDSTILYANEVTPEVAGAFANINELNVVLTGDNGQGIGVTIDNLGELEDRVNDLTARVGNLEDRNELEDSINDLNTRVVILEEAIRRMAFTVPPEIVEAWNGLGFN